MGYKVEFNTMLRLGVNDPKAEQLVLTETYTIEKENARIYPVEIPILLLLENWTVFGYCIITSTKDTAQGTKIKFHLVSIFTETEQKLYTDHLKDALKISGYQ